MWCRVRGKGALLWAGALKGQSNIRHSQNVNLRDQDGCLVRPGLNVSLLDGISPVLRAPASLLGLHQVERVNMAGVVGGVGCTAVHHLPVDQDHPT